MFEELKYQLKVILQANNLIQEVYDWEVEQMRGYPVAIVVPSANDSDYRTTTENMRVYAFSVILLYDRGQVKKAQDAEKAMTQLVDSVLDDFDKNWNLSGVNNPTGMTFLFLEAVPSSWGYMERESSLRIAQINLRCHVNVDVNLIN